MLQCAKEHVSHIDSAALGMDTNLGILNCHLSNWSSGRMDEDGLPSLQASNVLESVVCGGKAEGKRCRHRER